jgi:hypothetical protein
MALTGVRLRLARAPPEDRVFSATNPQQADPGYQVHQRVEVIGNSAAPQAQAAA